MKLAISLLVLCVGFSILTGCASIVSDSKYPVTINSNPSGAMVTVRDKRGNDIRRITTPVTLMLPAGAGFFSSSKYYFQFEKDGYYPYTTSLSASMDGWYVGNFLVPFAGFFGIVFVDPATGAMWKLNNNICGDLSLDPRTAIPEMPVNTKTIVSKQE
jgi:hypothetical protein